MRSYKLIALFLLVYLLAPSFIHAQEKPLYVSGWLPYWSGERGMNNALENVARLDELNPFVYTVKSDGTLFNNTTFTDDAWVKVRAKASEHGFKFIPTIMWSGREAIHAVLSNDEARRNHVGAITREVFANKFDGIDIDYENKSADTRIYFSLFLKELDEAIGYNKDIVCTIEARMPVEDRYAKGAVIPTFIEYSNDFSQINQYCDRVRIMAYDQGRADITLIGEREHPYTPVADTVWVEKVMRVAAGEIDPSKLSIGVATYGYEYDMFLGNDGVMQYSKLWSFNPGYANEVAGKLSLTPVRNSAGELTLTFPASSSPEPSIPLPYATRVLTWSDGEAVQQKVDLAAKLGLQGYAIFKIDGGEDKKIWDGVDKARGGVAIDMSAVLPSVVAPHVEAQAPHKPAVIASMPSRDLALDDTGEDVRTLQKYLNDNGFIIAKSGPGSARSETTIFGYATQAALIKFQTAHGILPATGAYGPKTRAKLTQTSLVTALSRDLALGDTGEDVRTLQTILNRVGYVIAPSGLGSPGQETTKFGALTQKAVITYQEAHGITPALGNVGPKTRASLLAK